MSFYDDMRSTASELISEFGTSVTLTRTIKSDYDPITGSSTNTESTIKGNGVFLNYSSTDIDGELIRQNDKKMLFTGDEPKINDTYNSYVIVEVGEINPDVSGVILYTCQMRK